MQPNIQPPQKFLGGLYLDAYVCKYAILQRAVYREQSTCSMDNPDNKDRDHSWTYMYCTYSLARETGEL